MKVNEIEKEIKKNKDFINNNTDSIFMVNSNGLLHPQTIVNIHTILESIINIQENILNQLKERKMEVKDDCEYEETVFMPPKKEWEVVCIKPEKYKKLQAENKKLKKENKKLKKEKWELEGINEACRRENEAYQEMWEEFKRPLFDENNPIEVKANEVEFFESTYNEVIRLEQKFLGGRK